MELGDEGQVQSFYRLTPPLWASIHAAGGFAAAAVAETSLTDFRRMLEVNAVTSFPCCREAVGRIRSAAGAPGGRIVNVTARPALIPAAGLVAYSAGKAAVASLTLSLAEELADERIWVNAALPSVMDTPDNRRAMPGADFAKWAKVGEVAAAIEFLASPGNSVTRARWCRPTDGADRAWCFRPGGAPGAVVSAPRSVTGDLIPRDS